jgi:hypothetical protein
MPAPLIELAAIGGAEEMTAGVGHDDVRLLVLLVQPVDDLVRRRVRPVRDRRFLHDLCHRLAVCRRQHVRVRYAEDDAVVVHDDAHVPGAEPTLETVGRLVGSGRRRVGVDTVADRVAARCTPHARQARREPIHLAGGVVVDLPEAEALEPARGSGAQVSQGVGAVDDHRAVASEPIGLGREIGERDVDRARDVLPFVGTRLEDVDELSAVPDKRSNTVSIEGCRHDDQGVVVLGVVVGGFVGGTDVEGGGGSAASRGGAVGCGGGAGVGPSTAGAGAGGVGVVAAGAPVDADDGGGAGAAAVVAGAFGVAGDFDALSARRMMAVTPANPTTNARMQAATNSTTRPRSRAVCSRTEAATGGVGSSG